MTNAEILQIALQQSAYDCGCNPKDFLSSENKIVLSQPSKKARAYLQLPYECDLVSYGNNIVAQASPRMRETVEWYIGKYAVEHCFESPNVIALNERLAEFHYKVCFMAEYFLPDMNVLKELPCDYEMRVLQPEDFELYYTDAWANALCEKRKHLDVCEDIRKVEGLIRDAFWNVHVPGASEHFMAHRMRMHEDFVKELNMVAELDGKIVGSIMYTRGRLRFC